MAECADGLAGGVHGLLVILLAPFAKRVELLLEVRRQPGQLGFFPTKGLDKPMHEPVGAARLRVR